ncbi:MAG: hypothetical protein ABI934_12695 [Actinomycetota bacterium]
MHSAATRRVKSRKFDREKEGHPQEEVGWLACTSPQLIDHYRKT